MECYINSLFLFSLVTAYLGATDQSQYMYIFNMQMIKNHYILIISL